MTTRVVLGIDLGSTATKVVAADASAVVHVLAERGCPMLGEHPGEAVHDPRQVLTAALEALTECVVHCGQKGLVVDGLSLTGAMHTLMALDANNNPLTHAVSWADNRAADQAARIKGSPAGAELHRATGTPVHPFAPLSKLVWFHEKTDVRAVKWCSLKDFVLLHLTGRLATEHSYASGSGLMNMHTLDWHPESLRLAGITADQLPELVAPTDVLPLTAQIDGLPTGLPVVAGGGDGPLANLGVGAVVPGMAALSLGTSGALRVVRDEPGIDEHCRVFCYAIGEGLWVLGGAISNGGSVAAWAAKAFGTNDIGSLLAEAESVPPGAGGLLALPYLLGERAPWWDPDPRAMILGLRREHGRAQIVRALIEGVGQQLALVRDAVAATGAPIDRVRATGGAFRSPLWAEVISASLGTDLELAEDSEGSGLGAALLGWRALGELSSLRAAADLIEPVDVVRVDAANAARSAAVRPVVERAYEALRTLSSELAEAEAGAADARGR
ncbi:FGGY family carbohydrate kinase [Allokutzneria multivorans]|uniref:FGGY family carbohydrate kinase n=1 Tax=Allokutzneria multivorans TaxID=1142134 RepID=A0ABP7RBJ2_9PSEU